jgi:hypothetical protein
MLLGRAFVLADAVAKDIKQALSHGGCRDVRVHLAE